MISSCAASIAVDQHLLGDLVRLALDHHDRVGGASDDHVELALGQIAPNVGLTTISSVDQADADRADRTIERNRGDRQRRRGADDRQNVRIVLLIGREDRGDDLDLRPVALREERANRAVGQAGGQNRGLGRATFTLDEAAGILPAAYIRSS